MKRISLLILSLLFFATAFQSDKLITQGWYRQYITNLNGSTIKDMTFLDSLTGFAVSTSNSTIQAYILKTTNGGDNWNIIYTYVPPSTTVSFTKIQFTDSNIGFASTNYYDFIKTTNNGQTWINYPNVPFGAEDMAVINKDTIFVVSSLGFGGGVYRSINGGINWSRIWTNGSNGNPKKIYMFDKNMGFSCYDFQIPRFRKTTNGGFNWFDINDNDFYDIKFIDSLTGWKVNGTSVKKTTNGGINWFAQSTPSLIEFGGIKMSLINKDTIWFVGSTILKYGNYYGVIHKTTNGGLKWGYQIPDTSIKIDKYYYVCFTNKNNGWAFQDSNGVHTKSAVTIQHIT